MPTPLPAPGQLAAATSARGSRHTTLSVATIVAVGFAICPAQVGVAVSATLAIIASGSRTHASRARMIALWAALLARASFASGRSYLARNRRFRPVGKTIPS